MKHIRPALQVSATKSALCISTGSLILATLGLSAASARAEEKPETLPDTTILANRTATSLNKVGSSVTVLDTGLLSRQGINSLDQALKHVPGVFSESIGGQKGSGSDIFIRGTRQRHTHFIIDGMRVSDINSAGQLTKIFLGTQNLNGFSKLEVLRGPQGAIYGGDSIGGVIGIYSARGREGHHGIARLEGGSFNSLDSHIGLQGAHNGFAYSLTLGYQTTDNDTSKYLYNGQKDNDFEAFSYSLRLDYALSEELELGMTLRGADTRYEGPRVGSAWWSTTDQSDQDSILATLFATYQASDIWSSKLTIGFFDQENNFVQASGSGNTETFAKLALYWDNTLNWNRCHKTVVGAVYEDTEYTSTGSGVNVKRNQYGVYANHIWDITDALHLSGGLRWENYDSYGKETTWRVAAAYDLTNNTKLHTSVGKGYVPPSFQQLYDNNYYNGNADLEAETSIGWDLGVTHTWCDGRFSIDLTYFENEIENAIQTSGTVFYPAKDHHINVAGITKTQGLEATAKTSFAGGLLDVVATYTYLGEAVVDLPRNVASLRVNTQLTDDLTAGITASYVDSRSYGGDTIDAYTLVNLYGNYKISEDITFGLRIDNLLDEKYEYYKGFGSTYPGRGRGIFGSISFTW